MSMFYVYIYFLFYTFPPPFDKAEPLMAFAVQLSWYGASLGGSLCNTQPYLKVILSYLSTYDE